MSSRVRIRDLVGSVATWNPERASPGARFTYIDLGAVDQDAKSIVGAREIDSAGAPSRARQIVTTGDVLVSTVRPNLNGVAKVPSELDGATASTGFCVLRPDREVLDAGYLFHWVRSPQFVSSMVRMAAGASYPAISDRIVLDSEMPLPAMDDQRRVADLLNRADVLRAERRFAVVQLEMVAQAIFLELFGDPVANERAWPTATLAECSREINDCPHTTPTWTESGAICLRTSNLTEGGWDWSDTRFVSEETFRERSRRGMLEAGDIVLSREGTVGIAAVVAEGMRACMGQRLVQVRPDARQVAPQYLLRVLLHALSPDRIGRVMIGSTSQHLNVKELRALRVPRPPIELQRDFACRVDKVNRTKRLALESVQRVDELVVSLQHRAFTGQL